MLFATASLRLMELLAFPSAGSNDQCGIDDARVSFVRIIHPTRHHGYVHPLISSSELQWVSSQSDHPCAPNYISRQAPCYPRSSSPIHV
ncbi:hypothetical protein OG21DRAFT_1506674 [Imleria badia]|nr:hypothetical protein OG21DRAFT_1506674 [Imleria badia]